MDDNYCWDCPICPWRSSNPVKVRYLLPRVTPISSTWARRFQIHPRRTDEVLGRTCVCPELSKDHESRVHWIKSDANRRRCKPSRETLVSGEDLSSFPDSRRQKCRFVDHTDKMHRCRAPIRTWPEGARYPKRNDASHVIELIRFQGGTRTRCRGMTQRGKYTFIDTYTREKWREMAGKRINR